MQLKKLLTIFTKVIVGIFGIAYPFIVFMALKQDVAMKFVGFALLVAVIFSWTRSKNTVLFIFGLILCLLIIFFNQEIFVKLYPVLMNVGGCAIFALSLKRTPIITQFAQKVHKKLDANTLIYTRHATRAWAIFLGVNAINSLITVFLPDEVWMIYNGFISYVLIARTMLVEYIIRKKVLHDK